MPVSNVACVVKWGAPRPVAACSTTNMGFCENERIQPIEDCPSTGFADDGVCVGGAGRGAEPAA